MKTKPIGKRHLEASNNPTAAIRKLSYEGQPDSLKFYRSGYEGYFNEIPVLGADDEFLQQKVELTKTIMNSLGRELFHLIDGGVSVSDGHFERTILAIEEPKRIDVPFGDTAYEAGNEMLVAHWGKGFASPIHGHSDGYIYENIISGKVLVNTYIQPDKTKDIVVHAGTTIQGIGNFVSEYKIGSNKEFKRRNLIHNFVALEQSHSLHLIPEYNRDGRDNEFKLLSFEDTYKLNEDDFIRITGQDGIYLQEGDVVLVSSSNAPEYGTHYIIVTGPPVMKEHGMRPQDIVIPAKVDYIKELNRTPVNGLVLLKMRKYLAMGFLEFHQIKMDKDSIILPSKD